MSPRNDRPANDSAGFTLIEVLVAMVFVAVALLAFAQAFTASYLNVVREGKDTMAVSAARQLLEDVKQLPFAALDDLNGFDSDSSGSLPTDQPARDVARRLRYSVAGAGGGWTYSDDEMARWSYLHGDHGPAQGRARVTVTAQTATMNLVTVTVSLPGQPTPVQLTTLRAAF